MFTDSPYYGKIAGHRHMLIVDARRNCPKHVTLTLENGHTMIVDNDWPVMQVSTRRRKPALFQP